MAVLSRLDFHKMQSLGNDFVLLDQRGGNVAPVPFARLADRRLGIGCDQFLLLQDAPADVDAAIACSFVNADGSKAEQCGNGLRSVALYMRMNDSNTGVLRIFCADRIVTVEALAAATFRVDMGAPILRADAIPVARDVREVDAAGGLWSFTPVSMGNPHAVIMVEEIDNVPLAAIAASAKWRDIYPDGVNVGVMQVQAKDSVCLRVHERGAGETRACGTGACAAMVAGYNGGLLDNVVQVKMPGGSVTVEWQGGSSDQVWMTGTASYVYEGMVEI